MLAVPMCYGRPLAVALHKFDSRIDHSSSVQVVFFTKKTWRLGGNPPVIHDVRITYLCVLHREFEGMIHWLTINNPSNPQQPIHSLRLAPVRLTPPN